MARIGGNLFEGVRFPVVFGDRCLSVSTDALSGAPLLDVYRWDRASDRLLVELFQGRPLPGGAPLTVEPFGGSGAVRLGAASDSVIGYLAGGDDPRSIVISPDRLVLLHGDTPVFEMVANAISGFDVGIMVDDEGGVAIGAALPPGFPERRLFSGATLALTDLVGLPPIITKTEFHQCRLLGPAVLASLGPVSIRNSTLPPPEQLIWELPVAEGEVVGAIGLLDCVFDGCSLEGVAFAVPPGGRDDMIRRLRES